MVKSYKKRVMITLRKSTLDILDKSIAENDYNYSTYIEDLILKDYLERKEG